MPKNCCAFGCSNVYRKGCGLQFYRFPVDSDRRRRWVAAIGRKDWAPTDYSWICSEHFATGVKSNHPLAPNYIPTLFKHISSPVKRSLEGRAVDFDRRQSTKKRRTETTKKEQLAVEAAEKRSKELAEEEKRLEEEEKRLETEEENKRLEEIERKRRQDEIFQRLEHIEREKAKKAEEEAKQEKIQTAKQISELDATVMKLVDDNKELLAKKSLLECELAEVKHVNSKMERQVETLSCRVLSEGNLENDNSTVKYFTGLPSFSVLKVIYNFVSKDVPETSGCPKFDQYLLTLMKLRLNVGDKDLAFRFGISQASVSRYINKWVDVLSIKLAFLIHWPERQELLKTMPSDFRKHFKKCVIIIDCFEVFIERPTSLMARAQTFSNYKKHNTVKFLIGISPQGSIAFISKGWGGRVSDVYLTENCGILEKLLPGDMILADRGFTIQEAAGLFCAEVKIPPFTKGKKQLSKAEVDTARQLAHVRIHVERVIGVVRQKYTILQSTLPINMIKAHEKEDMSPLDKIVIVCCALCNCCDSVVPFD